MNTKQVSNYYRFKNWSQHDNYFKDNTESPYDYLAFAPNNFDVTTKQFPVLFFFSGYNEGRDPVIKTTGNHDSLEYIRNLHGPPSQIETDHFSPAEDMIVISPQCVDGVYTSSDITLLLDHIITKYPIDINKIYLTGVSCGGNSILNYIHKQPLQSKRIAAAFISDLLFGHEYLIPDHNPNGDLVGVMAMCGENPPVVPFPIWIFNSARDPYNTTYNSFNCINLFYNQNKSKVKLSVWNIGDHGDCLKFVYNDFGINISELTMASFSPYNMSAYSWLLQHSL